MERRIGAHLRGLIEDGATVCVQAGTTSEKNVADYFAANGLKYKSVVFDTAEAIQAAFFAGRCQAYTTDASGLASVRNKEAGNPDDHVILPELISKEPLGPSVRRGDDEWYAIAKWVVFALIEAEEYGITQANVDAMVKDSKDPVVQRILGTSEDTGKLLGLDKDWAARAIKAVGNYGEIFERNVGPKSALGLPRGMNNWPIFWSKVMVCKVLSTQRALWTLRNSGAFWAIRTLASNRQPMLRIMRMMEE